MVYSLDVPPKSGQRFRDRVRCITFEKLFPRTFVKTLDDKHNIPGKDVEADPDRHCCASFCDVERMKKLIFQKWGFIKFCAIFLDYFFSPVRYLSTIS